MEAVKQGSCCVGLKSKTHTVVAVIKRNTSKLSAYQKKIFKIDGHMGIAIAGLTADARVLCKYMRTECLNHTFVYDSPLPVGRLVRQVADKSQVHTQRYGRRPYGVGLLVAGWDKEQGPQLYETCPSGNSYHYKAHAIGARSQSARTYLERTFETFPEASLEDLIKHAILALRESAPKSKDEKKSLHVLNVAVGYVGEGTPFTVLDTDSLQLHLDGLDGAAEHVSDDDIDNSDLEDDLDL